MLATRLHAISTEAGGPGASGNGARSSSAGRPRGGAPSRRSGSRRRRSRCTPDGACEQAPRPRERHPRRPGPRRPPKRTARAPGARRLGPRDQLEPNDLAGGECLVLLDESSQEVDRCLVASKMVDGDRRVEQLHSSPRRLRRSLRSPRAESTYSPPVKPRPRHEPALASSAWSLSAFVGCPKVLRTARRTSSDREAPVRRYGHDLRCWLDHLAVESIITGTVSFPSSS